MSNKPRSLAERFYEKVEVTENCWRWKAAINKNTGYGHVFGGPEYSEQPVVMQAHRVSWLLHRGPIPHKMLICHTCDNRWCVNPEHLFVGNKSTNAIDMIAKNRHGAVTHPERMPHGANHPGAKLSEAQVVEIRRRWDAKESYHQLAREYEVSPSLIRAVGKRAVWKHIP